MDNVRELNFCCEELIKWTKEFVENPTPYIKWCYKYMFRDIWLLNNFNHHLASEKAYDEFFKHTGRDIRDFNWSSDIKIGNLKFKVHSLFVDEHLTTANDFRNSLIELYKSDKLTVLEVSKLIKQQQLCWITQEENAELNKHGFNKHRDDPYEAYKICGINLKK